VNVSESNYRASQKYQKEKCRKISLLLNKKIDEDILVWLDSQENKVGYLKKLIREDMARQGFEMPRTDKEE
jgi:hypothetical protein